LEEQLTSEKNQVKILEERIVEIQQKD